jgi:hypothetical protein
MSFQQLWNQIRPDQRRLAAKHFWSGDQEVGPTDRREAISAIALARRSRLTSIKKAEVADLEKWTAASQRLPSSVLSALIRSYLLNEHQAMIAGFLDDLHIPNAGGVMAADFEPEIPASAVLHAAIEKLRAKYKEEVVQLYLAYVSLTMRTALRPSFTSASAN